MLLDVKPARSGRTILLTGWPVMLVIVVAAIVLGGFFPGLAGLLVVGTPLAVIGAFAVATIKARTIRLTVTGEVVRVSSGKSGITCDRDDIDRMVLVESLKRRKLVPRAPALILLDNTGHAILLLDGLLWPGDVLERVVALLTPIPTDRREANTTASLAAVYPGIFRER